MVAQRTNAAVNHLDIAPRTAGIVVGIVNTYGALAGAVAPWCMGVLTEYPEGRSRDQWGEVRHYIWADPHKTGV
jgi:hypothetical protein